MIDLLAWICAIAGLAAASWLVAGLLLGWRHSARAAAAILLPAIGCAVIFYWQYHDPGRAFVDQEDARMHALFISAFCIGSAIVGGAVAVPVWFVLEERFGHRTTRD